MIKEINSLLCSGGGVKGIAYIGVMKAIEEYNTKFNENEKKSDKYYLSSFI